MNQRILLPALVLGAVFAAVLAVVHGFLPNGEPAIRFVADAAVLIVALTVYGALMQRAVAPALDAVASRSGERSADRSPGRASGRERARTADRGGERSARGDRSGRGSRGAEEKDKDKAPRGEDGEPAPAPGPREEGRIKWFSGTKGFGFIVRDNGTEIFVHHRGVRGRRRDLPDGIAVSFVVVERQKGPQADDVEVLEEEAA